MELLREAQTQIAGSNALVIGRSAIVGMPMALLLSRADATVTISHSKTQNLEIFLRQSDIVIAAVGRANWLNGKDLKPGCTVIDVGINRTPDGLCGDVDYQSALPKVRAITPVPGGVGPMTIAMLLKNAVSLAEFKGPQ
jgi:methylenetetrahydrofolate dehydrogenase (NADP+) / methenyltetrahydrofolate cyclohydrolase